MILFHTAFANNFKALNHALLEGYLAHRNDEGIKRTHLFNERYENVYMTPIQVPALTSLLAQADRHAQEILGVEAIRSGCWFNDMPPGATTTLHRHDDGSELLSAVYYVEVPALSGELVLHYGESSKIVRPEAGKFVFFSPELPHEVSKNCSDRNRISIGINFGPERDQED